VRIDDPEGSAARPLGPEELAQKARQCLEHAGLVELAPRLLAGVTALGADSAPAAVFSVLSPATAGAPVPSAIP
jgi:hypothetical protein